MGNTTNRTPIKVTRVRKTVTVTTNKISIDSSVMNLINIMERNELQVKFIIKANPAHNYKGRAK